MVDWPSEAPADKPVAIDALLVAKISGSRQTVGLPGSAQSWKTDPMAQLFLSDAIDYLKLQWSRHCPPAGGIQGFEGRNRAAGGKPYSGSVVPPPKVVQVLFTNSIQL